MTEGCERLLSCCAAGNRPGLSESVRPARKASGWPFFERAAEGSATLGRPTFEMLKLKKLKAEADKKRKLGGRGGEEGPDAAEES